MVAFMDHARRNALKLVSGSFVLAAYGVPVLGAEFGEKVVGEPRPGDKTASDGTLALAFDDMLRTRVSMGGKVLTPFQSSEVLLLESRAIEAFAFSSHTISDLQTPRHGAARRHT